MMSRERWPHRSLVYVVSHIEESTEGLQIEQTQTMREMLKELFFQGTDKRQRTDSAPSHQDRIGVVERVERDSVAPLDFGTEVERSGLCPRF